MSYRNKDETKDLTDEERNEGRLILPQRAEIRWSPLLRRVCKVLSRFFKQLWLFNFLKGERKPAEKAVAQRCAHPPVCGLIKKY